MDDQGDTTTFSLTHNQVRESLHEYVTLLVLKPGSTDQYRTLEAHLAQCHECQAAFNELRALSNMAFADGIVPAQSYPPPDLSFLPTHPPPTRVPKPRKSLDRWQALTLPIAEVLAAGRQQGRVLRGQLLCHHTHRPRGARGTQLILDIFAEGAAARVQVSIDLSGDDADRRKGLRVLLQGGTQHREALTDDLGAVDFVEVPINELPLLRVEVQPQE